MGVVSNLATHEVLSANFVHESMGFNHVIQLFLRLVPAGENSRGWNGLLLDNRLVAYEVEKLLGKV